MTGRVRARRARSAKAAAEPETDQGPVAHAENAGRQNGVHRTQLIGVERLAQSLLSCIS